MKIFMKGESSYDSKVNFVDTNGVFVGYDMAQDCCELASWHITDNDHMMEIPEDNLENNNIELLTPYTFDKKYFVEWSSFLEKDKYSTIKELDEGRGIILKLVAEKQPDLYLYIFNAHNGYYGHGFEVVLGGETVYSGVL